MSLAWSYLNSFSDLSNRESIVQKVESVVSLASMVQLIALGFMLLLVYVYRPCWRLKSSGVLLGFSAGWQLGFTWRQAKPFWVNFFIRKISLRYSNHGWTKSFSHWANLPSAQVALNETPESFKRMIFITNRGLRKWKNRNFQIPFRLNIAKSNQRTAINFDWAWSKIWMEKIIKSKLIILIAGGDDPSLSIAVLHQVHKRKTSAQISS